MILFFNQNTERLKHFYYVILIITGFLLAVKIPQSFLDTNLILMLIPIFLFGIIPLRFEKQFDFALNAGFVFITVLNFGLGKTILPLLVIVFLSYIVKFVGKIGFEKAIYRGGFDTVLIVLTNILGVLFYNSVRTIFPVFLSVFTLWLLIISINIIILYIHSKIYKYQLRFNKRSYVYFAVLSLFVYTIAFVAMHILFAYSLNFYIIHIIAIALFFAYLHIIQVDNKTASILMESMEKVNRINLIQENNDLKGFIIFFYNKLRKYISLSCIGIFDKTGRSDSIVYCEDVNEKESAKDLIDELKKRRQKSGIIIALKEKPDRYLISFGLEITDHENLFISYIADNINVLKESEILFNLLKKKIEIIIENIFLYDEAKEEFLKTIEMIISMIEAKDKLTAGHSIRVAKYSYLIGQELGLKKKNLDDLKFAALLHDIGKIAIPENILNKKAELTEEEFKIMRRHPILGAELIKTVDSLKNSIPGIIEHHERYDGSGYPKGLKGEEISLQGRIIAIADAFDAVTSNRVYRYPIKRMDAIAMIIAGSYSRFDPNLVEIFTEIIKRYKMEYINEDIIKFVKI
ncbi:MAG: HD domain-containing protein [Proteobacteria bacterium]|nr:HD domain-containing protein [Pseudomonadota bacterium]